ncbi:hypothetical protein NM688_g2152 [Phlebia brevispora]|uniref:Uncharacterized protein n=1 Tax=Phlebia brevispora TaxID=194682 RepID=A0ACC1T9N5_9APHY|nr:hypothetical protein NM688_g2152 [Phlebia brevispora]
MSSPTCSNFPADHSVPVLFFSLDLAGQPAVVINALQPCTDLLDRRSNIYSDRPRLIIAGEVLSRSMLITIAGYNDLWRNLRRAAHEGFGTRAAQSYHGLQELEAALLTARLLRDPDGWDDYFKFSAASTVLSIVYGWSPKQFSQNTHIVQRINQIGCKLLNASKPGAHIVEIFPALHNLPTWLAPWKRDGDIWFNETTRFFVGLINEVKGKIHHDGAGHSFARYLLENKTGLNEEQTAWLAGTMFTAGMETTAAALSFFVLAMVLHPDIMHRAQAEIDNVIGRDRLPSFADETDLPYVVAIVKEVLRWRPVAPIIPRRCTQDDWYNGYLIPKGTYVFENVWAINHDPAVFPDPEEFRPERYLNRDGHLAEPIPDTHGQGHLSFGSGRRICAGKEVGNQALFINVATILWAAHIEKAVDDAGAPITPSRNDFHEDGLLLRPAPFKCVIRPRTPGAQTMLAGAIGPDVDDLL